MNGSDNLSRYYLGTALQAMEQAHAHNRDNSVGPHISRAISALHELMNQAAVSHSMGGHEVSDPYEINEFNSAV
ncbi:MAG TPA: hypothetical protein VFF53_13515 [Geobacteraceae bacterium]|nr:hypothetical protein [Geobacteraceae bacterium]